jgi:DMSO/TMAO reductase YedYZ molybdopterin-dependent catalytic subunit
MRVSGRAAAAGVASAAVGLGVAEIVAAPIGPRSAPLIAVGGVVVDNVPEPVKQVGIAVFGVHDKTALLIGTAILLALYAAAVGVLAARSMRWGYAGIAVFALVGVTAAATRHDVGWTVVLPTLVGAALAVPVLRVLLDRASDGLTSTPVAAISAPTASRTPAAVPATAGVPGPAPATTGAGADGTRDAEVRSTGAGGDGQAAGAGRRRFLMSVAVAAGVAAVSGLSGRLLTSRRAVTAARAAVTLPPPAGPAPVVPPTADLGIPGLSSYVSANSGFYRIDTALYAPQVDPATWQLRIHGMVRNPITVSFADLLARPLVERYVTLACVSNEVGGDLIGNARWLGVAVKDLLDEAQPLDGADQVVSRSADGWTCGTPTAALRDGRDALLAVGMNGEPLPVEHGFPVRMVVPGLYGYVSACKWIVEMEVTRFADFDAYWVPRGWSAQGPIKTQSRIDTPRPGADVRVGVVTVAGVAWAQHRGITRVEVQVDDEPWQTATLAATVSTDTWRQWSWRWQATRGRHTLRVRATDNAGTVQTERSAPVEPDGATGWHERDVEVA